MGFGSRDLGTSAPTTPETLYGVGSVTRSFTALAVLPGEPPGRLPFFARRGRLA